MSEPVYDVDALEAAAQAAKARVAELTADYARQSAAMTASIDQMSAALDLTMDDLSDARAAAEKVRGRLNLAKIRVMLSASRP